MASLCEHHKTLTDGVGKCSVPMWINLRPAGFCDRPAYGKQEKHQERYGDYQYGYWLPKVVANLACEMHGGPAAPQHKVEKPSEEGLTTVPKED